MEKLGITFKRTRDETWIPQSSRTLVSPQIDPLRAYEIP